jgi:hypothetical protein
MGRSADSAHRDKRIQNKSCTDRELWAASNPFSKPVSPEVAHAGTVADAVSQPTRASLNLPFDKLASTHTGVAIAIARLIAEVRVQQPSAQQSLPDEPGFLQYSRRTNILDIADCADTENRWLSQSPGDDLGQNLGHQSLAPPSTREHVAAIESMGRPLTERKRTPHETIVAVHQHVRTFDIGRCRDTAFNVGSMAELGMNAPLPHPDRPLPRDP